jgi:hypothetical protein
MTNDNKKLYRVDWKHTTPIVPGQVFDEYMFVAATSETDATTDLFGTNFKVREATIEEIESYVRGYEDGYDQGVISERLHTADPDSSVTIEDLEGL